MLARFEMDGRLSGARTAIDQPAPITATA